MPPRRKLSLSEARRIALAAQGFHRPRPSGPIRARHIAQTIRQLGLIQIDSVNVLVPAHYHVLFSRLGPYDRSLLDEAAYRSRAFTEQWAHEASIIPVETWPLLRHRMEAHRTRPYGFDPVLRQHPGYPGWVMEQVRERGPLTAEDIREPEGSQRRIPGAWYGTIPRIVLEVLFGRGLLAVAGRRPNFTRVFDLSERLVPPELHAQRVEREEAQRHLLLQAARAHGVGTAGDLADYFRMPLREARQCLMKLTGDGLLRQVEVEGWPEPAWIHPETSAPRKLEAWALLSPFDPVVWRRPRASRLFQFDYQIEIYTPKEKRKWGYCVLPFLLGDQLAARADLKADRANSALRVLSAHLEPGASPIPTAEALAEELKQVALWLNLTSITVSLQGNLARPLRAALRSRSNIL